MNGSATWSFMMFACELCAVESFFAVALSVSLFGALSTRRAILIVPICNSKSLAAQHQRIDSILIKSPDNRITHHCHRSRFSGGVELRELQFGESNIIFHVDERYVWRIFISMVKVWMEKKRRMQKNDFFQFLKREKAFLILFFLAIHDMSCEENSSFQVFTKHEKLLPTSFLQWNFWPENDGWSDENFALLI